MQRSKAYTGPDDWGSSQVYLPDIRPEDETGRTLEVEWGVYLNRAAGDYLLVDRISLLDGTPFEAELTPEERSKLVELLKARYEPTEDL